MFIIKIRNYIFCWFLFSFISIKVVAANYSSAQKAKQLQYSQQVKQLKISYNQMRHKGIKKELKAGYIKNFPQTAEQFHFFFSQPGDSPLYDGNKYILQLEYLVESYPIEVMSLVVNLSSQITLESDASEYLQLLLMKSAVNYSHQFAKTFSALSHSGQTSLLAFMTDGKKGPATGYSTLIHILSRTNHSNIANQMQAALTN